jgi:galactoside 2-L-fucosyltransferase 1/2
MVVNPIEGDTVLPGDFQSYRYFEPNIRKNMRIQVQLRAHARILLSHLLTTKKSRQRVAIHVRKLHRKSEGSFMTLPEFNGSSQTYLHFPTPLFFESAMAYVREKHPFAVFVVLSDDPGWCKTQEYLQHQDTYIIPTGNSAVLDLALIAECDHVILTRGTFGWWGAFLGAGGRGGIVVYNAMEFDMHHPINAGNVVLSDFYPAHWVALNITLPLLV